MHIHPYRASRSVLRLGIAGAALAGLLASAASVQAHHATGNFDQTKQWIFTGKVRKFVWGNPHVWLYVDAAKADGKTELWGFETNGTNTLTRAGIRAADLKVGEPVTVHGAPDRTGKHIAAWGKVVKPDGRTLQVPRISGIVANDGDGRPVTPVDYK